MQLRPLMTRFALILSGAFSLFAPMAQAKFMTPWEAKNAPFGADSLLEECQYRWESGEWVLYRKTGYGYDGSGNLIHASLYSREGSGPAVNKEWDFAYNADRVWTRVAETPPGDTGTALRMEAIVGAVQNYAGADGKKIQITNEWAGNRLFAAAKSVSESDSRGELKSRLDSKYAAGLWTPVSSTRITRDAAGRILREDFSDLLSGTDFSTVHEYDASGSATSVFAAGRFWETWEYAPGGKPTAFSQRSWINGAWARIVDERYQYDADGNRILLFRETDLGDRLKYESVFDAAARTEVTIVSQPTASGPESFGALVWVPAQKTEILKNAVGDTIRSTESAWSDGTWKLQQLNTTGYDSGRRANDHKTYFREGDDWVLYNRSHVDWVRDGEGRILSSKSDWWLSGNEATTGEAVFEYDSRGRTLLAEYKDVSVSGTVTGSKTTHRYLTASPQSAVQGPQRKRAGAARPVMASGTIRRADGALFNAGGRALPRTVRP